MNRDENGKLIDDVKFDEVSELASLITPVPGGVGPMTITMLMEQTYQAFKRSLESWNCFDLDGTLSFDYMTIDEEIKQVLLTAPQFGHEVLFASGALIGIVWDS